MITYILHIKDTLKLKDVLGTLGIHRVFDCVNHLVLVSVLKKYVVAESFINWIIVLLKNQAFCVVNGWFTTKYFKLGKGTRQGDPIFAYLLGPQHELGCVLPSFWQFS